MLTDIEATKYTNRCQLNYPLGTCWAFNNILQVLVGIRQNSEKDRAMLAPVQSGNLVISFCDNLLFDRD